MLQAVQARCLSVALACTVLRATESVVVSSATSVGQHATLAVWRECVQACHSSSAGAAVFQHCQSARAVGVPLLQRQCSPDNVVGTSEEPSGAGDSAVSAVKQPSGAEAATSVAHNLPVGNTANSFQQRQPLSQSAVPARTAASGVRVSSRHSQQQTRHTAIFQECGQRGSGQLKLAA